MKLYKSYVKFYYQQQYKDIIEKSMVSTPKRLTENSPIDLSMLGTMKKLSARKFLGQFLALLDVKQNAVCRLGSSKTKRKATMTCSTFWSSTNKCMGHRNPRMCKTSSVKLGFTPSTGCAVPNIQWLP